jgi:hypothetical protein
MEQGMPTSDDYKNYVQPYNRGTMLKPRDHWLTAIHHQATVHKKTLVIMADSGKFKASDIASKGLNHISSMSD